MKYRIFWTNHSYYSQEEFTNLEAAIAYGKSKCFEFTVSDDTRIVASWSPIGGLRTYQTEAFA